MLPIIRTFFLFILFFFSLTPSAYAADGSLRLFPSSLKLFRGAEFRTTVVLDTGNIPSVGTDVFVNFDPDKLELMDIIPASAYSLYVGKTVDNVRGRGAISGIVNPGESVSGSHIFGYLHFRAKKEGQTDISFDFTPDARNDSNIASIAGVELLGSVSGAQCQIVGYGYSDGSPQKFLGSFKYRLPM